MTLKELIKITGQSLEIMVDINGNYYAHMKLVDVVKPETHGLLDVVGRGKQISEAIKDYCDKISNKTIRVGLACTDEAPEFDLMAVTCWEDE